MAETIIGGLSGSQNYLVVNSDGSINVSGTLSIGGNIVIGSVSANVDSIYIQSGANIDLGSAWTNIGSVLVSNSLNINAGSFIVLGSVNTYGGAGGYAGSDVYIKAGSVQTYSPVGIGSIWFGGGIGSVTLTNSLPAIGSYTGAGSIAVQTISGTITIDNRVAGSIVNLPGVDVNNPTTIGSFTTQNILGSVYQLTNPWIVLGSFAQTNTGSITITNALQSIGSYTRNIGSEVWTFGSVYTAGSINIVSPSTIGSYTRYIGSESWVNGSIFTTGSIRVANLYEGSEVYIKAGSIQTYNPAGVGSVTGQVTIGAGSVQMYGVGSYVNLGKSNFEIIRKDSGSPFVWYTFSNLSNSVGISNLGSSPVYFNFNGSANPANSGTGFIDAYNYVSFDLSIGSVAVQASGITSPPVQVVRES